MQAPEDPDDKTKPQVEYLFYTEPPNARGTHLTIDNIVEFGFPSVDEFAVCKQQRGGNTNSCIEAHRRRFCTFE